MAGGRSNALASWQPAGQARQNKQLYRSSKSVAYPLRMEALDGDSTLHYSLILAVCLMAFIVLPQFLFQSPFPKRKQN